MGVVLLGCHRKAQRGELPQMDKKTRREGAMTPAIRLLVSVVLAMLAGDAATAEDLSANFPNRPIRIIVPFPAGGPSDIVARLIGQKMSEDWGQPVVIDNRPGGNTIIGAQAAAKAAPDGYTLFMAIDSTLVMNQFLYKSLPYDPVNDFVPITTTSQIMGHLFHRAAGLDIVYVPFKGTPETVNGLLTGSVQLIYAANLIVAPLIASGQLRALAKLDRDAPPSMADIPTLADAAGLPALEDISIWLRPPAPNGTPKPIIDKINAEVVRALTDPTVKEKSERTGNYPVTSTPEQFAACRPKEAHG